MIMPKQRPRGERSRRLELLIADLMNIFLQNTSTFHSGKRIMTSVRRTTKNIENKNGDSKRIESDPTFN